MSCGDKTRGRQERGFTLLEAMLALAILSVGLLATAAMQDMALRGNVDANELGFATSLATEMAERIRYNARNVTAYNSIDTSNSATRPASTQTMARGDYDQWQARLAATPQLRNAKGKVTVTASGPTNLNQSLVAVQVTWSGKVLNHSVTLNTVLIADAL
nr:type IV pilus modification protein PilV [Nitrospirota bacterium]